MHLNYGFLADAIVETHGKKNAIGIYNMIIGEQFPCKHPFCILISLEARPSEQGEHNFEFLIADDNNHPLMPSIKGQFQVQGKKGGDQLPSLTADIVGTGNVVFQKPGHFQFIVRVDNRHLGAIPFHVARLTRR